MARGVSVSAFDLGRIAELDPAHGQTLMAEVRRLLDQGVFTPRPYRRVPVDGAFDVLRRSLRGAHVGRDVIDLSEGRLPLHPGPAPIPLAPDGANLVTGGVSGISLALTGKLAAAGARHLVLISRRGRVTEAEDARAAIRESGARVDVLACDVADASALDALIARFGADLPPLRGVIHAAGLLSDATVRQMRADDLDAVLAPKLRGGWNLHRASLDIGLDFFVTLTSVANMLGNVGQANSAAANAFLDALIHHRRAAGLPGVALALGVVGAVGFVARDAQLRSTTRRILPGEITVDEVCSLLCRALHMGLSHPIYGVIDWERAARVLRRIALSPRFDRVAGAARGRADGGDQAAVNPAEPPQARRARLSAQIHAEVAGVLGLAPDQFDPTLPLAAQGVDSLLSVELMRMSGQRRKKRSTVSAPRFPHPGWCRGNARCTATSNRRSRPFWAPRMRWPSSAVFPPIRRSLAISASRRI